MAMQMPKVSKCTMMDCAFNTNEICHAIAINVEEGSPCAVCHTYTRFTGKAGIQDVTGGVGACKIASCKFNNALECTASGGILIERHGPHADCSTFST